MNLHVWKSLHERFIKGRGDKVRYHNILFTKYLDINIPTILWG